MSTALQIALAVGCAAGLLEALVSIIHLRRIRTLARLVPPAPERWPKVSVVIAARNEASTVGPAMASRLADDYPELELVFIDDRSEDGTGDAVRRAAQGDRRLAIERVEALPEGWLGKLNAMHLGAQRASGEWLLFSDADVHLERGALRKAVAHCLAEKIDFLALVPAYRTGDFAMDMVLPVFLHVMAVIADPHAIRDPAKKRAAVGSGAFNLVRRELFERSGGFEPLRMETGDDVALAAQVKAAGGQLEMIDGNGSASVAIYRSLPEFFRGIEKNGSSLAPIPFALLAAGFALYDAIQFAPLVALSAGLAAQVPWLAVLGAGSFFAATLSYAAGLRLNTDAIAPALFWPLALPVMQLAMLRSVWLAKRRGGVLWRGTFYSLAQLEAGRRFKLF